MNTLPYGNMEDFTLILSRPDHTHVGMLRYYDELHIVLNLNTLHEISFTAYHPTDEEWDNLSPSEKDMIDLLWNELVDFKYVYVRELNEYFEIGVEIKDEANLTKAITGTQAVELDHINLYDLEINTDDDIARDEYILPTVFYRPDNPNISLLHRALEKAPQWSVGHVDVSLYEIQRTFSASGTSIYDFFNDDVSKEVECLFEFNTADRVINVYDLNAYCLDCGHRGDFSEVCPKCGSTSLQTYGEETTILIDTENLADDITYEEDLDSVKNTFRLVAGDDDMTAAVRNLNPNGSNYIYYFSDAIKHEMPKELVDKLDSYQKLYDSKQEEYQKLTEDVYEAIDKIVYYRSSMMPTVEFQPTTAADELKKITAENFDEVALSEMKPLTSVQTVNNAIKSYVKLLINSGRYKVEIQDATFTYVEPPEGGNTATTPSIWKGKIKLISWGSNNETDPEKRDDALSGEYTVKITTDFEKFIDQKIKAHIKDHDDEDGSVYDVLTVKDLDKYKEYLTYYCLNRLNSFMEALIGIRDIMIEAGQGVVGSELYDSTYTRYLRMIEITQEQIDHVSNTISVWEKKLEECEEKRNAIQKELNFEDYLGKDLYKIFSIYKREDQYENSNYIHDDLEDNEIFEVAKQFYEAASKELVKSGESQHTISGTVHNFLAMKEFAPLKDHFRLGNFIRTRIDGKVYKLRLTQIGLNQGGIENLDVEFSDIVRTGSGYSDIQSILASAKKMATSYSSNLTQIKKNSEQADIVRDFVQQGMSATAVKIVNNADRQDWLLNDTGLTMRTKVEYTENDYDPCQTKMIGSGIYFTDNNWRTVKAALGKYIKTNPETGEQEVAYGLLADSIIGRLILGNQLGIYSEDGSSTMSFDNNGLILNTIDNGEGHYKNIFTIQKDGQNQLWIDNQGNIVLATDQMIKTTEDINQLKTQYAQIDNMYVHNSTLENLFAGNAGVGDLQVIKLTANNCVLADASIAKAVIAQLNAGEIDSAFINTDFIKIGDTNGNLQMMNSTLQIVDDNDHVRVQIGKDEKTGEFSYWLWNENGDLIWEPTGITAAGVPDQLIVNDMVADNAAIKGSKLDIDSVVRAIEDDGTLTMDITKIQVDGTTLNYLIQQIQTKQDEEAKKVTDIGTNLNVVQGQIDNKVWQSDIKTATDEIGKEITTINDKYSEVTQTIDGHTQTIKDIQTKQTETESEMNTKFNQVTDTIDSHTQKIEDLSTKVSNDYNEMSTKYNDVKDTLDSHTQTIADVQTGFSNLSHTQTEQGKSIDSLNAKVSEHTQSLTEFSNTLTSVKTKTEEDITDLQSALEGKADSTKVETIEREVSSIKQTQNSITLSVSSLSSKVDKTVKDVTDVYLETSNNKIVPNKEDANWSTQPPVVADDHFLWSMRIVTYTDGTTEKKEPYCVTDKAEDAVLLRIDSDNGYIFKNNQINTKMSITIMKGRKTMTTLAEVKAEFGDTAKILWKEKPIGQSTFIDIASTDSRIQDGGMSLLVNANSVNQKTLFNAYLDA